MPTVIITRVALDHYTATSPSGASLDFGRAEGLLTPVELLLAALGGCGAVDVDHLTSRRAEPELFEVEVNADKVQDAALGNRLADVQVTFRIRFGEGAGADRARDVLPKAVDRSHDRLCTVSRSLELQTPVAVQVE
jgi:uncharacterized OsmC-like protein